MFGEVRREYCVAPGVYIEGVHPDGVIGPDEEVHTAGNCGFSLIRELRYYFVHLFFLCNWADVSLRGAGLIRSDDGQSVDRRITEIKRMSGLARGLANSRVCMFPDERFRRNPGISFSRNARGTELQLELRGNPQARSIMAGTIKSSFRGDAISRSYKLPYMGQEANERMYAELTARRFKLD
jgi:hypothetical protein